MPQRAAILSARSRLHFQINQLLFRCCLVISTLLNMFTIACVCKTTGQFIGRRDNVGAQCFQQQVVQTGGFFELHQEHHTFEGGRAMSRLDRVYANWHVSEQLDRTVECTASAWPHTLSDHRPLLFARRSKISLMFRKALLNRFLRGPWNTRVGRPKSKTYP